MKKFLLLSLVSILTSCATSTSSNIPTNFNSSTQGMIVGTFAFENEKPIFNQYFFHYEGNNDKKSSDERMLVIRPEQMWKMKFNPDFKDGNKAVYLFSITEEVEGEYRFYSMRLHENGGYTQQVAKLPMDFEFKIEKGKVKYLGEIYFNYRKGILTLNNEKQRDLEKFKEKFPQLKIE